MRIFTTGTSMGGSNLFLGIDCSTQSMKITAINESLQIKYSDQIEFKSLVQYKTADGVIRLDDTDIVAPSLMFVEALDMLLTKLSSEIDISTILAMSASGQQHGSVYLKTGSSLILQNLDSSKLMQSQLKDAFSIPNGPIWMNSSTSAQCALIEEALGGSQIVADLTGSRSYERFTGPQIARIMEINAEGFLNTERICLISSLISSLFLGKYAPIDSSDGSGMNLMDIKTSKWSQPCIAAVAKAGKSPNNAKKILELLGENPIPAHECIGTISKYFVRRYGFHERCLIIASSGDNPCTLAGIRMQKSGDVCVSLGTSSTVLAIVDNPHPSGSEGHILRNPIDPNSYMAMLCFKNGALARNKIMNDVCSEGWDAFNNLLSKTAPGNGGNIGFYYLDPEITPRLNKSQTLRFDSSNRLIDLFDSASEARAVIESQFLSMRVHANNLNINVKRIFATGGASVNTAILQILSNVFGCEVYVSKSGPNTAALGSAYRAVHGYKCSPKFLNFSSIFTNGCFETCSAKPDVKAFEVYSKMLGRFSELEKRITLGTL